MDEYEILDQNFFEQFTDDVNIIIQYVFRSKKYEIGLINSKMKTVTELEKWFYPEYKNRPVQMTGYAFKKYE